MIGRSDKQRLDARDDDDNSCGQNTLAGALGGQLNLSRDG